MWADGTFVAPETPLNFGWIVHCLQIIGHGDDREEKEDQHRQGDELDSAARASVWSVVQPLPEQQKG